MTHVLKIDLDHPTLGTFLVLTRVNTEDLSQRTLLTRLVRECVFLSMYVCVTMNLSPFKCVAFPLETRNFTSAKKETDAQRIDRCLEGQVANLDFFGLNAV